MLPKETLLEILANLSRRDLDALELVNRALGSLITAQFNDAPIRVISLMFDVHDYVIVSCPSDGWRHVPVPELPRYIPRSVIPKMVFKWSHTITEDTYRALLPCRAHFTADAVCEFRSLSVDHPGILRRALTEVFKCSTIIFDGTCWVMLDLRRHMGEQEPAALPCFANCSKLQLAHFNDVFADANGALEWLLGTHATSAGVKFLFVVDTWSYFLVPFVVAIEQQFIDATTPACFEVELLCASAYFPALDVGTTREHVNAVTKERLQIDVDTDVRQPNGEPAYKTKVAIQRMPTA